MTFERCSSPLSTLSHSILRSLSTKKKKTLVSLMMPLKIISIGKYLYYNITFSRAKVIECALLENVRGHSIKKL